MIIDFEGQQHEFPDDFKDADIAKALGSQAPQRSFLDKLGSFARKVYEDPQGSAPFLGGLATLPRRAPEAARELTFGADPEAAREAAGTALEAASLLSPAPAGQRAFLADSALRARTAAPPLRPMPAQAGTAAEAVAAASRLPGGGVTLPGYIATESTVMPQGAAALKNVPWGGQPIVRSAEKLTADLGRAAGEIAPAVTSEAAGGRASSGLRSFIETRSQKPVSEAYKAVDDLINPEVRVPLTNTAELVKEMRTTRANARIPGSSKAVDLVSGAVRSPLDDVPPELMAGIVRRNPELAQPPGMNYAGIKDLRTYLRSKTPQQLITEGIDPTEAKRILGALTKDLGNVVRQSSPEAFGAWQEANALASRTARERQALARTVGVKGDAPSEQVFERLATYAKSKAGADLNRLRLAKRAMGPEAWNEVGSALINRLGKAAPDTPFSPDRFVTAWGNMSGAAKQELFSGQQAAALNDLFIVSNHVKERITKFGNPSGTARGMTGNTIFGVLGGGALWAEPVSVITSIVGMRLAAEAMSRPAIVRAATQVSRASLAGNPVATRRALARLQQIAVREQLISGAGTQQERPPP
jgi:hypothetical protein